jgi:hypothetical protein
VYTAIPELGTGLPVTAFLAHVAMAGGRLQVSFDVGLCSLMGWQILDRQNQTSCLTTGQQEHEYERNHHPARAI